MLTWLRDILYVGPGRIRIEKGGFRTKVSEFTREDLDWIKMTNLYIYTDIQIMPTDSRSLRFRFKKLFTKKDRRRIERAWGGRLFDRP